MATSDGENVNAILLKTLDTFCAGLHASDTQIPKQTLGAVVETRSVPEVQTDTGKHDMSGLFQCFE